MQKKFEINWTNIKGGCQSGKKVITHTSKSDLPLASRKTATIFRSLVASDIPAPGHGNENCFAAGKLHFKK